jgi:hypothetical protein
MDEEYRNFIRGKRIAIVAHAASIVGTKQGRLIDSYDLVVRMNNALPIPEDLKIDIGTRCDILYSHMDDRPNRFSDYRTVNNIEVMKKVEWVCCPHPGFRPPVPGVEFLGGTQETHKQIVMQRYTRFVERMEGKCCFRETDPDNYAKHLKEMSGGIPNVGFAAVWDLLTFDVSEIFMAGFTFFLGGNYKQYITHPLTEEEIIGNTASYEFGHHHQIYPQLRYFKRLRMMDSRIVIDSGLISILEKI